MSISYVILGGGGHAAVIIDALKSSGVVAPFGILDRNEAKQGSRVLDVSILGRDTMLPELVTKGVTHFIVGLGSTAGGTARQKLFELGLGHNLAPLNVTHPSSTYALSAVIGRGSHLLAGSIVNARARIGENAIINTGAIVEHDCIVGDHAHIATGACLAGNVVIGERAFVGARAVVKQGVRVGIGATIGAGAVVVKDVDPHTTVAGVPARLLVKKQEH